MIIITYTMEDIFNPISFAQISISAFIAIVFLQSATDKILDWSGNHAWLKDHFSKTFVRGLVAPMLALLTIVELMAGIMGVIGIACIICCADESCAFIAVVLSLLSYLMLIFGQRIAKDYDGAKTIAIYFGVSLMSLLFF